MRRGVVLATSGEGCGSGGVITVAAVISGGQFAVAAYLGLGSGEVATLQDRGCHNINFVTPEHVVPQILEALPPATEGGLRQPIVCNTSSYDSLDSLRLMDGIVDFAAGVSSKIGSDDAT